MRPGQNRPGDPDAVLRRFVQEARQASMRPGQNRPGDATHDPDMSRVLRLHASMRPGQNRPGDSWISAVIAVIGERRRCFNEAGAESPRRCHWPRHVAHLLKNDMLQ